MRNIVEGFKGALVLMVLVFLISGCAQKAEKEKIAGSIPVKVLRVELKDLNEVIDYVGNVKAYDETIIYPKVSGKIIEKVKEDGSEVAKGEAIAYLDRDEVGLKFEKAPVESPITGVIGRVYVDIGTNVTAQTPVALVVNMDKVKITLDIPEKYIPKVMLAQEANISVDAYPQEVFKGIVAKISPVVDTTTRSAPIEIVVDNTGHRLQSGMFAKISLVIGQHKNAATILKEAVIGKAPDTYVYVVEDKKAALRKVTLGIRQGPYYEVSEGLKQGAEVVIMGQQRLKEGSSVETEEYK